MGAVRGCRRPWPWARLRPDRPRSLPRERQLGAVAASLALYAGDRLAARIDAVLSGRTAVVLAARPAVRAAEETDLVFGLQIGTTVRAGGTAARAAALMLPRAAMISSAGWCCLAALLRRRVAASAAAREVARLPLAAVTAAGPRPAIALPVRGCVGAWAADVAVVEPVDIRAIAAEQVAGVRAS
jgi:hypothetical protein